jgi:hypothetical protein
MLRFNTNLDFEDEGREYCIIDRLRPLENLAIVFVLIVESVGASCMYEVNGN